MSKNKKVPEAKHILLNIKKLIINHEDITTTISETKSKGLDNELAYTLDMSYPAFKPTNETIKRNAKKQIYPAIFLIKDYYIDKEIIKQTTLGKNLNNKKLLTLFTKRKDLSQIYNEAYNKGLIEKTENTNEKKKRLIKSINFILDLLFKQKNNFYFQYSFKTKTKKNKSYKKFGKSKNSILLNRKIFNYKWRNKNNFNNKSYELLIEKSDNINSLYITEYDTYYSGNKKRLFTVNIDVELNLYSGSKINKNETRKLKCNQEKSELKELLDEIKPEGSLDANDLFYNLFAPLLQDEKIDDATTKAKRIKFEEYLIKNIDKKSPDFELISTMFNKPQKGIEDELQEILDKYKQDIENVKSTLQNIDTKSVEFIDINQEQILERKILKDKLLQCFKDYYDSINDTETFKREETYLYNRSLEILYPEYLDRIERRDDYEDKFYFVLKDKLNKYNLRPNKYTIYFKKIVYDLLMIKNNMLEFKKKENNKK